MDEVVVKPTYTQFNQCFQLNLISQTDESTRTFPRPRKCKVNHFTLELHGSLSEQEAAACDQNQFRFWSTSLQQNQKTDAIFLNSL